MEQDNQKGYIEIQNDSSSEYEALYLEGIDLLQKLAGGNWTDYNEHDPGVTILENLAYTLTDLSYKTTLPFRDLLVESKGSELESGDNAFFEASKILTTNPVTINDLRKTLIDQITNVKNLWVHPYNQASTGIELSGSSIKGLYNIFVEMYKYPSTNDALLKEENRITEAVKELFHQNRSLCESLNKVEVYKPFYLHMKLKLTLDTLSGGEEIFAKVLYDINDYLTHEVRFHPLWQMQQSENTNDIFNGPELQNGFIANSELTDHIFQVVPTDVIRIISKVNGVRTVDDFELLYTDIESKNMVKKAAKDKLDIPEGYFPKLQFPENNEGLILENGEVQFPPDLAEVKNQLAYIQSIDLGSFKSVSRSMNRIPIPEGQPLGIEYYPLRQQFPSVYGIGDDGLQTGLHDSRYAQALQLKGFLMPLDQLMNDFLTQLTSIYKFYDVSHSEFQSYFTSTLSDMPDLVDLIKNNEFENDESALLDWSVTLNKLIKKADRKALIRLNQVADHLLSRFAEEFPTYALKKIHTASYGKKITNEEFEKIALSSKRELLEKYDILSYNRAKGVNYYRITDEFDLKQAPGLIQKTAILLGIKNAEIRSLTKTVSDSGIKIYGQTSGLEIIGERLSVEYDGESITEVSVDEVLIIDQSVENLYESIYFTGNKNNILEDILKNGVIESNYSVKPNNKTSRDEFLITFSRGDGDSHVVHIANSEDKAQDTIKETVQFLVDVNTESEGLYLIEHILLAPPHDQNHFGFDFIIPGLPDFCFQQEDLKPLAERNKDINSMINAISAGSYTIKASAEGYPSKMKILDSDDNLYAVSSYQYQNDEQAQSDVESIQKALKNLSPKKLSNNVLCFSYYGNDRVEESFFSLQISLMLPSWPVRFQNPNFRMKFNNVLGEQLPAYLAYKSYWLSYNEMIEFERAYFKWMKMLTDPTSPSALLSASFDIISKIENHYFLKTK